MLRRMFTGAALAMALAIPAAAQAPDETLDEARVRELVLETIRENPEIVMEALSTLQARQAQEQADAAASLLEENRDLFAEGAPVIGNEEGDVTIVEFFDYNCPYCKRAAEELDALLKEDDEIRVVMREWPILSEGSVFAARASLAAQEQGLYRAFHDAMMQESGPADEDSVMRVAEAVGLDLEKLRTDMKAASVEAHIGATMELAQALGINGTPSFVIGETLIPGFVDAAALAEAVKTARAAQE